MKFPLSVLGIVVFLSALRADMAPLISTKKVLGNGKYLLVMLFPPENTLNKENPLHKQYPKSGLYANDGTNKPLWTLEPPFQGQVFLSADGDFLANVVFPTERKGDGIRFYHKGKLVRSYKVEELARPDAIQEACPSCIWSGNITFNEADETMQVESRDGRNWRFELRTGKAIVPDNPLFNVIAQAGNDNAGNNPPRGAPAQGFAAIIQDPGTGSGLAAGWIVGIVAALVLVLSLGGFLIWRFGIASRSEYD